MKHLSRPSAEAFVHLEGEGSSCLVAVKTAARQLGISVSKLYELLGTGALRARKVGRSTLFLQRDLDAFVAALPAYEPQARRRSAPKGRRT